MKLHKLRPKGFLMVDQPIHEKVERMFDEELREVIEALGKSKRMEEEVFPALRKSLISTKQKLAREIVSSEVYAYLQEDVPTFRELFGGLHEPKYTQLLSWLLSGEREGELGPRVFKALFPDDSCWDLLEHPGIKDVPNYQVIPEASTEYGRPDLKIYDNAADFIMFLEVKTGADESGGQQLKDYGAELDKSYDFSDKFLLCLCRKDTSLKSESIVRNHYEGVVYGKRYWTSFIGDLYKIQQDEDLNISCEARLLLRILIRDQIMDISNLDQKQLDQVHELYDSPEELPEIDRLLSLKNSVKKLE